MIGRYKQFSRIVLLMALSVNIYGQSQQRYLALMMLNLNRSYDADLDILEASVKAGCNAVHLTIHWDQVYTTPTQADWRKYDNQLSLCQKLGVKVALRIHVARLEDFTNDFWTDNDRQRDSQGKPQVGVYGSTVFSYAHRPSVELARNFIKEVCLRYNNYQQQGVIAWVSVTTTPTQEIGYNYENWYDNSGRNTYNAVYDYSPYMLQEYKVWLTRKYQKIARLNAYWQTEYDSFESILPPKNEKNYNHYFWGEAGKDWYLFRHAILKQFIEQTTETIKSVNLTYKVLTDFGSVFDPISNLRGTLAFIDLNKNTDGIKINDAVEFDNRFSADVIRSNARADQLIANEAFVVETIAKEEIEKQIEENYSHGTHWLSLVIGTMGRLDYIKPIIQKTATKWLKTPYAPVNTIGTVTYNLSKVLEFGYYGGGVYNDWANKAGSESNRQPVNLKLVEDLLNDTLQGTLNRVPILKNQLPTKIIQVNTPFDYKLSSEVFVDIDGLISRVEATGLPSWLRFLNNTFSGTPSRVGTYQILLKAFDDDGATVATTFTIVVDKVGKANQKPIVKKKLNDVSGLYKQPFIFVIPTDIFEDSDGFISRIDIIGLPNWAQYRKGEIRGIADVVQRYTLILRAFDDENASTETTMNIIINYPSVFFDLISGGKPGQRVLIKRLINNETLPTHTLPSAINVYASCDAIFDAFDLKLTGPYFKNTYTNSSPFSLFVGDGGFPLVAGYYTLVGKAYFRKEFIASTTYNFTLQPTNTATQQPIPIDVWSVFPNPCTDFVSIKLPNTITNPSAKLTDITGRTYQLMPNDISHKFDFLTLNLTNLQLNTGLYFLTILDDEKKEKIFKLLKKESP